MTDAAMTASVTHKVCTRCHHAKPLADFKPRANGRYGVMSTCTPCATTKNKRRQKAGKAEAARLQELIVDLLRAQPGLSAGDLSRRLGISGQAVRGALGILDTQGRVQYESTGKGRVYYAQHDYQPLAADYYLLRGLSLPIATTTTRHRPTDAPVRSPEPPARRGVALQTVWGRM